MALGLSSPPSNLHLCDHDDDSTEGCSNTARDMDPLALYLVWRKPSDTGGGDAELVKILQYEVEVSRHGSTSHAQSFNFTEDALGELYAVRRVARVALMGLAKGQPFGARVRVRNFLGVSAWNSTPDDSPRIPLSQPSAPRIQFVGSGGEKVSGTVTMSGDAFHPFLSVFFHPAQDLGTGMVQNVSLALIKEYVYVIHISTSVLFEPTMSWEVKFSPHPNTLNRRSQTLSWKIVANSSERLEFGHKYFVRLRTQTIKGFSNWSSVLSRTLLNTPGPATGVNLTIAGPMALKLTWAAPTDFGIGVGRAYPLRGYQIVFQTAAGPPNLTISDSIVFTLLDFEKVVERLRKGIRYFAHVRVQNEAIEGPDQFEPGFGQWTAAMGQCVDGKARSKICGHSGLVVVDAPTAPMSFGLKPVGDGVLLTSWSPPLDAGNGSSAYPLIRYELQFADDASFSSNIEIVHISRRALDHRAPFDIGAVKFARIRAVNDANASAWSSPRSADVLLLPSVPRNVTIANKNMSILIQYTAPRETGLGPGRPSPLLSYEVLVNSTCLSNSGERTIAIHDVTLRHISVQGLTKGCTYSFSVRAQNLAGWSDFSAPLFESFLSLSTAPTGFLVQPAAALELQMSWRVPADTGDGQDGNGALVLRYRVDVSSSPTFNDTLRQIETVNTTIKIDLLPRILLYCRVVALTRVGWGDAAIAGVIPIIPTLSAAVVLLSSNVTGASTNVMISFTTTSGIQQLDRISIRFPRGFNVSQATISAGSDLFRIGPGMPCGTDCRESSELLSLVYTAQISVPRGDPTCGDDVSFADAWGYNCAHWNGRNCFSDSFYSEENLEDIRTACSLSCKLCTLPARIAFSLQQVANRNWAGHTGPFELRLLNPDGTFTVEESLNVSGTFLTPGVLENPSVRLSDVRTGSNGTAEIGFSLSDRNPWPADGKISIEFPAKISLGGKLSACMTRPQGCDFRLSVLSSGLPQEGLSMADIQGQIVTLQRSGDHDHIPIKSIVQVLIPVTNDKIAGYTQGFWARTLTREGFEIDAVRLPGVKLAPGNLTNASVDLLNPTAYAFTDARVCFRFGFVGLPRESLISVTFSSAHFMEQASIKDVEGLNLSGELSLLIEGNIALLSVSEASPPFTSVCILFGGIRNHYAGLTGNYQIIVSPQSKIGIMEQHLSMTSNFIIPANLEVDRLEPTSLIAGQEMNLLLKITIKGALNFPNTEGGRVILELPAGSETMGVPSLDILEVRSSKMLGYWELKVVATNASFFPVQNFDMSTMPCQSLGWLTCGSAVVLEMGGAFEWPAGTSITFQLSGIRNRPFDGPAHFRIFTTTLANHLSDLSSTLQMTLLPNQIRTMTVRPESILTNSSGRVVFSFLSQNPVPPECDLRVTIPPGYTVPFRRVHYQLVQQIDIAFSTLDGDLAVHSDFLREGSNDNPLNFTIYRRGGTLMQRESNVTFTVFGLTSRSTSGSTGNFSVVLLTLDGNVVEQNLSVPGFHLKYAIPRLEQAKSTNSPCAGKANITLVGRNFGHVRTNKHLEGGHEQRSASLGWSSCLETTWTSDSAVVCSRAPGFGGIHTAITIEQQAGTLSGSFTYDFPFIKEAPRSNLIYARSLQMLGVNFQTIGPTGRTRVGSSSAESTIWHSDTAVICSSAKPSSNSLSSQSLRITLGRMVGSVTDGISFDFVEAMIVQTNTRSADSVTIQIRRFEGSNRPTPATRLGLSACESTHWDSVTVILCKASPSIGQSLQASVTAGTLVASSTSAFSADRTSMFRLAHSDAGCATLSLDPLPNFVGAMQSLRVRMGGTQIPETRWLSATAVLCRLANGAGRSMAVVMTVGQAVHSATELSSYFRPMISGTTKSNTAQSNIALTLEVTSRGLRRNSVTGRIGVSSCEAMEWLSSTTITCMPVMQRGVSLSSVITAGHAAGTMSHAVSFDAPVGILLLNNAASKHDPWMVIHGVGFGRTGTSLGLRLGISAAAASSWGSDTALRTKSVLSLASSTSICVTSGKSAATRSGGFSFDLAHPALVSLTNVAVPHTVSTYMTAMHSTSFSSACKIGRSTCEASKWVSDTVLNCKTGRHIQSSLALIVTAGGLTGTFTQGLSHDSLSATISSSNVARVCKISLTNAAEILLHQSIRTRVGRSADESSDWTSHTTITCKVSQHTLRSRSLLVTTGSRSSSISEALTYDLLFPSPRTTNHANILNWKMGSIVSIASYSTAHRVGDSALEKTEWIAETSVLCHLAASMGGSLRLIMTIGAGFAGGSETRALSYYDVMLSSISANLHFSIGIVSSLAVYGSFFGRVDFSATAALRTSAEASHWGSDSSMQCKSGPSIRASLSIKISSGLQISSTTEACSYDSSSGIVVALGNRPLFDTMEIEIFGSNLGSEHHSIQVSVAMTSSLATEWQSTSSLRCKAARGISSSHSLVLTTQSRAESWLQVLSFNAPCVSRLKFGNRPAHDGTSVPIVGAFFGDSANSASSRMALTAGRSTTWVSGTSLVALSSFGLGVRLSAIISVGQNVGSHSLAFSYDTPVIQKAMILSTNIPKAGVVLDLSVVGQNFGTADYSPAAVAGLTSCDASLWHSDSSISCYAPHGTQSHSVDMLAAVILDMSVSARVSMTYDSPALNFSRAANAKPEGMKFTDVLGSAFGVSSNTQQCAVGASATESTRWLSDSSCLCQPSRSTQMTKTITLTSGSSIGSVSEIVSFDTNFYLQPHSNRVSASTSHGGLRPSFFSSARSRVGTSACEGTWWASSTSLVSKSLAFVGSSMRFVITEGAKPGTLSGMFSSDTMALESLPVASATRNVAARASIRIHQASQTNLMGLSSSTRFGVTACENTIWNSLTAVSCQPGSTYGGTKSFTVTAGTRVSSASEVWSSDSIVVDAGAFFSSRITDGGEGADKGAELYHGQLRSAHDAVDLQDLTSNSRSSNTDSMIATAVYGAALQTSRARVGKTECEQSVWMSFTSLQCRPSKGTSGTLALSVTAGLQSGTYSGGYSWDLAFTSVIASHNSVGRSSSRILLLGAGFSHSDQTSRGLIGSTTCHSTQWLTSTSILCHIIRTSGASRFVGLTVLERVSTLSESFTVDTPIVSAAARENFPGGSKLRALVVTLRGRSLGIRDNSLIARTGQTGCEITVWERDTSLVCLKWRIDGFGSTTPIIVTAGRSSASLTEAFSSDLRGGSALRYGNAPSHAAAGYSLSPLFHLLLERMEASSRDVSLASRAGLTNCEFTTWRSQTAIACRSVSAFSASRQIILTSGRGVSSLTQMLSMDKPRISACSSTNLAVNVPKELVFQDNVVLQTDFSQSARVAKSACEASYWLSSTSVVSRSAVGAGRSQHIAVTVGSQVGSASAVISFNAPSIIGVETTDVASPTSLTLTCAMLGHSDMSPSARTWGTSCVATEWTSASSVLCSIPPQVARDTAIQISVCQSVSTLSYLLTFSMPSLSATLPANMPQLGHGPVLSFGSVLGLSSLSPWARLGLSSAELTVWISDSSLSFSPCAGGQQSNDIALTIFSQTSSVSGLFSYNSPALFHTSRSNLPCTASTTIGIAGFNMGAYRSSHCSRLGGTAQEAGSWVSDTSISALCAHGQRAGLVLTVTSSRQASSLSRAISFDKTSIKRTVSNLPDYAIDSFRIRGIGFGIFSESLGVRLGATTCASSSWLSDTCVSSRHAIGVGRHHTVVITQGHQVASISHTVTYDMTVLQDFRQQRNFPLGKMLSEHGMYLHRIFCRCMQMLSAALYAYMLMT